MLNLLVDRPPGNANAVSAWVQFGFATPPGALTNGMEIWLNSGPVVLTTVLPGGPGSQRFAVTLPPGPTGSTFAFQVVCGLTTPTCSGFALAATPAMNISF